MKISLHALPVYINRSMRNGRLWELANYAIKPLPVVCARSIKLMYLKPLHDGTV